MSGRKRIVLALSLLLIVGVGLALHPRGRRLIMVAYLVTGDRLAPVISAQGEADLVIFDAGRLADRDALSATHGALTLAPGAGGAIILSSGTEPTDHEVCTRRFPRDWSAHQVLRLELMPNPKPEPVFLTLRARTSPGLWETSWYYQRVLLRPWARAWEINLTPASRFIDSRQVKQLCLALRRRPGGPAPTLSLRRVVLRHTWSQAQPPPSRSPEPFTMHVLGDSTRIRRLDPVPRQPWLLGPSREVTLKGARNEVLAVQLVLRRESPRPMAEPVITLPPLTGPGPILLQAELFWARTLRVRQQSSASYGLASLGPGEYPDPLEPLIGPLRLARGNNHIWIDLHIPAAASPGTYRGLIEVKFPYQTYRQPITVEVADVTLPAAGRQLVMVYYLPQLVGAAAGVQGQALNRLEREYHQLAQAHGAFLVYDTGLPRLDRYLPMMRGDLYKDGPARGQGAPYWPVPLDARNKQGVQRLSTAYMRWFQRHGLTTQPFAYLADEPQSLEAYRQIRQRAAWVKAAPAPGNQLPIFVTEQVAPEAPGWPSLVGAVDYWVSGDNFPEPAASRRRTTAERFFTYNGRPPHSGSQLLDPPGTDLRSWGWIAHRFDMDSWFLWQGAYYRDIYNDGPVVDPLTHAGTYDRRRGGKGYQLGNGDGVLIYPPPPGHKGPLASMRLKALRRGVQDRLYLELAGRCGKGEQAMALARELIPRALGEASEQQPPSWPQAEEPWEKSRHKLIEMVSGCKTGRD